MVNGEFGRELYKAYRIDERRVALQWLYSGSTMKTNQRLTEY
ncbi:hypothetical protein HMPREF9078_02376 [Capnocytophaga sp. oral taxon 380 str. F0488]|nr:hypothetical protein HMPREF9078_02376 [Capnocytophaga sp. oral taxon 380 str. F0488]